ncbi:hypothetical protein OCQ_26210 [Mycobacterium paraintracellulare]|nr:hypothetical protein OCQ_26210 [Mycobacterium paraintracellulare]
MLPGFADRRPGPDAVGVFFAGRPPSVHLPRPSVTRPARSTGRRRDGPLRCREGIRWLVLGEQKLPAQRRRSGPSARGRRRGERAGSGRDEQRQK